MSLRVLVLGFALSTAVAESATVVAVPAPDQLLVKWHGIPVVLPLAYLDQAGEACRARLEQQAKGKSVDLQWLPQFGTMANGAGRVMVSLNDVTLNQLVVQQGLAAYQVGAQPDSAADKFMAFAQDKAKRSKVGIWAAPVAPVTAVAANIPSSKPVAVAAVNLAKPSAAFCAELGGRYYYPVGHHALAGVDAQRLIMYGDEGAAKRAGKQPAPQDAARVEPTMVNADQLYNEGRALCGRAMNLGNSSQRDDLYGAAFPKLNQATQIYAVLVDKDPSDELQEKMRSCMQLRYSALKYRRFE